MVWNPKLALGVAVILWVPCLLKKESFYIIGKQTSGFLCSQLYISLEPVNQGHGMTCAVGVKTQLHTTVAFYEEKMQKFEEDVY